MLCASTGIENWGQGESSAKSIRLYALCFDWIMKCYLKANASLVDLVGIGVFIFRKDENEGTVFWILEVVPVMLLAFFNVHSRSQSVLML